MAVCRLFNGLKAELGNTTAESIKINKQSMKINENPWTSLVPP